jgi:hypothetical protein
MLSKKYWKAIGGNGGGEVGGGSGGAKSFSNFKKQNRVTKNHNLPFLPIQSLKIPI